MTRKKAQVVSQQWFTHVYRNQKSLANFGKKQRETFQISMFKKNTHETLYQYSPNSTMILLC